MEIGIGLPLVADAADPARYREWATTAEERGFSSLAVIDRIVYPNYDPLIALAFASGVTRRIRLTTAILITPYRTNTALLAKELASLHRLSGGRLVAGVGLGARDDDYTTSGLEPRRRGPIHEAQIKELRSVWSGEERGYDGPIGPLPDGAGPELILSGHVPAALDRAGRLGDGWLAGGGRPDGFAEMAKGVHEAWSSAGRDGRPRMLAVAWFALGPNVEAISEATIKRYYDFPPDPGDQALIAAAGTATLAEAVLDDLAGTEQRVAEKAERYAAAGCDELIFLPCGGEVDQVDRLAEVVSGLSL